MQRDILDYLLLFVDVTFGQRHIFLCFQVKLCSKSVTATLSLQRQSNTNMLVITIKKSIDCKTNMNAPHCSGWQWNKREHRGAGVWLKPVPAQGRDEGMRQRMKGFQRAGCDTPVNSNKCVVQPSRFDLWLQPTCAPGPPAPIKGAVIATCQHGPQAPLLEKNRDCGRWRDKGSMKSCRNERGSFLSTVEIQRSFHAELKEMKEHHHEGLTRTQKTQNNEAQSKQVLLNGFIWNISGWALKPTIWRI